MEVNNFGAALLYAMHLEEESARLYAAAARQAQHEPLRQALGDLAEEMQRRHKTLERIRRENITEMILTPIHDFHSRDYAVDFAAPGGDRALRDEAVSAERVKARYYADACQTIELVEAGRALRRLSRAAEEAAETLAALALP